MTTSTASEPIPSPRGLPVLGNVLNVARGGSLIENLIRMAREQGPIFRLQLPGGDRLIVSGFDLVDEICDDARFDKLVGAGQRALRGASNGLFTSDTDDPLWRRAHNILMPPFGMQSMRGYVPMMLDVAGQLMDKWARLNPDDDVDVPADMTPADPGHDRAVRLRLPVQLLLPRETRIPSSRRWCAASRRHRP
jgi:cytochrome P450/NADPH-cytochrome P450 reductase